MDDLEITYLMKLRKNKNYFKNMICESKFPLFYLPFH